MTRELNVYLGDILESISKIEEYTRELTINDFEDDLKSQDAVLRCLEVIGEAVKNLPQDLKGRYPEIPWQRVAGMRDVLIHKYFGVKTERVWRVIRKDLPKLREQIEQITL